MIRQLFIVTIAYVLTGCGQPSKAIGFDPGPHFHFLILM